MDGNKLELTAKPTPDLPASYKLVSEADMEEAAVTRPKSLVKSQPTSPELDGADEKMLPKEEEVKASINEKQNGDAKLDIGEIKNEFVGLTKEELMKFANDPFWVRLRWFLFITFWVLWGLMLLGAILIILAAPKCNPPPPRTWWEKGPLAEVEQDSEYELAELKKLGVTGVILSWPEDAYAPFDETHEFIKAIKKYKDQEINVIVELEPGYSNVWFNKSEFSEPEFEEFYIWRAGKDGTEPPNNWVSPDNQPSWRFSEQRKQFYYAPLGKPHLNLRNANVTNQFSQVINKLLRYGVGGIRIKAAPKLLVDSSFANENPAAQKPSDCVVNEYCFYTHTQTEHLQSLAPLLKQWRDVVKSNTDNGPFMIREDLSPNIEAYKLNNSYIVDLPLQSHLFAKPNIDVSSLANNINNTYFANNFTWPLWKVNSTSEWDMITYLLPGTPLITSKAPDNTELLKIRSSESIMRGPFKLYTFNNDTVLAFDRVTAGNPGILVAFNPTENRAVIDFPAAIKTVAEEVTVLLYSTNYNETGVNINVKHTARDVPLSPKSAIVLSYVPKTE